MLNATYQFRDQYLRQLPGGELIIGAYCWFAERIIEDIEASPNPALAYEQFERLLTEAAKHVHARQFERVLTAHLPVLPQLIAELSRHPGHYARFPALYDEHMPRIIELLAGGRLDDAKQHVAQVLSSLYEELGRASSSDC
ncbi:MAG TPA: hypothetical protein VKB93_02705 [Thermoanaerobaculia bacterium]|nr:hypothetical protein [Thermoanaerobaculia bacterium]